MHPFRRWTLQSLGFELERCNLNLVFLGLSGAFFALTLAVAAMAGVDLSMNWFLRTGAASTLMSGLCVTVIAIRRTAPWLSWQMAAALPIQTFFCLIVGAAILKGGFPFTIWQTTLGLAWVGLALASGWGMFRNHWWGYFGEAAAITAVAAIVAYAAHLPPKGGFTLNSVFWIGAGLSLYLRSVGALLKHGFAAWNQRHAECHAA
jgi:hypothetical protein